LLEVDSIHVAYGRAKVLHDVSLRLNRGEMVFMVGRNGAGKTTLLKSISGLMKPSEGHIIYEGLEINGLSPVKLARRGVRYVAQDKKVFANLTVRGNVELAAYATGEEMSSAISTVTNIYPDMSQFLENKAGGLSGGQREILLIGRAMIGKPKLLLIDEPTEGLAAIVIEDILRILRKMKKENVSAIIVEQNLSVVSRLADRIYILKEGKVIREIVERAEIQNTTELEAYL
jgi:ABC-type branched-subunit amino acid transport system ATPase component